MAIGVPLLAGQPGPDLAAGDYLRACGGGLVAIVLSTMLGVGVGTLVGSQVPAVIGTMIWIFVLEPLSGLIDHIVEVHRRADRDVPRRRHRRRRAAVGRARSSSCSPGPRCSCSPRRWWTAAATSPEPVRVAALYDIHANPVALRAVLAELEREPVDLIVVGGDAVPGPLPVATLELLRSLGDRAVFVRGNTDRWTVEEFDARAGIGPDEGRDERPAAAGRGSRTSCAIRSSSRPTR